MSFTTLGSFVVPARGFLMSQLQQCLILSQIEHGTESGTEPKIKLEKRSQFTQKHILFLSFLQSSASSNMTILQHSNDCEVTAADSDVKGEDTNKSEDKKSAPAYTKGDLVIYEKGDTRCLVNVVGVDTMDLEPFYTVKGILCDGGTIEKQTIEKYLKCFSTSPSINSEVKDAEIVSLCAFFIYLLSNEGNR